MAETQNTRKGQGPDYASGTAQTHGRLVPLAMQTSASMGRCLVTWLEKTEVLFAHSEKRTE
jgi:hypothetical protein